MTNRIHWLTEAHYPDPLVDYSSTEFILEFQDAAQLLQQWRNPHLGRSSREGAVIGLASSARSSVAMIQAKLLTTAMNSEEEDELIEKLKVYRFLIERTLPEALELVNRDELLTAEDVQEFIQRHLRLMGTEIGADSITARSILNQLNTITDVEITDKFGRKRRISRNDILDVIGSVLGNLLARQVSLWPVDDVIARPRGRLNAKRTYKSAIFREAQVPPKTIKAEDLRVVDRDRLSLIYFIVDVSQSMGKVVYKDGLTRLDGALLTSLGLYYYFNLENRRKRREFDSYRMHIIPVTKSPYVIADAKKFEDFLMGAEAKGKTRLVHACKAAIDHVQRNYKDNNFDVQLVFLTDGRPNVPFEGVLPGRAASYLQKYFREGESGTPKDAQDCMVQLNQLFQHLKGSRDRNWNISYFLMASEAMRETGLFDDTQAMLSGLVRPIIIDPTEVDSLGKRILKETIISGNT